MTAKTGSKHTKKVTKNAIYYKQNMHIFSESPFFHLQNNTKQLNKTAEPKADKVSYISF